MGDLLFLVNYEFEARILNISDLENIVVVAKDFFKSDSLVGVNIRNDLAYFSAIEDGLAIFEIQDPKSPVKVAH
ncbi:MAG: hypothetical protein HeimC3_48150 [Candidatus Heimdallarchaeota archaeon LC_3]|nr:MAG: hypothetical protein HeimC3_48150 [Candidatus Heimdallarchaeota archaeon LC_3]